VGYLDVSSRRWTGFDALRGRIVAELNRATGGRVPAQGASCQCLIDEVEAAVERVGRPVVLVLDEFDVVAPELRDADQGELRGAVVNVAQFSLIVGMACPPVRSLEYVGDVVSDLSPILAVAQPVLGDLGAEEAIALVRAGRQHVGLDPDPEGERAVIGWTGSLHPLLLHAACFGWYATVDRRVCGDLRSEERARAEERVGEEIRSQRAYLERATAATFPRSVSVTNSDVADAASPGACLVDEVEELVAKINERHQLSVGRPETVIRRSCMAGNDEVFLRRTITCRADFAVFAGALARLLYDGSEAVVAQELRGKVKPNLPKCCYKDDRSPIPRIVAFRNFHTHVQSADPKVAAKHLAAAAGAFERYCGSRAPMTGDDYERTRQGLLKDCVLFLVRLLARVPLDPELPADALFV